MNVILDKKCRVEYKVVQQEAAYGTNVITWTLLGNRYCSFEDELPNNSESVKQNLAINTRRARVRFNYCTDIDTSMRLVINRPTPMIYHLIAGPAEIGNKTRVEFMAELYTTGGES